MARFVYPDWLSTSGFVVIVVGVCACGVWAVYTAQRSQGLEAARRWAGWAGCVCLATLAATAVLAETGFLRSLEGSYALGIYPGVANVCAVALACSSLGARVARAVPLWALVAFQGFRLPLELILHSWYRQGTLPVQLTFEGRNFDICTGCLALLVGWGLRHRWWGWQWAAAFNLFGFLLLCQVMRIALGSAPWPLRTFPEDQLVLLMFYAPYTWILPCAVSAALLGHLLTLRAILVR